MTRHMNGPPPGQLEWDYTPLADAYLARPDYADAAIDRIVEITHSTIGTRALDVGAGAGHLTVKLAARGWKVIALEPNAAMRAHGVHRTGAFPNVRWIDGLMENTGLPAATVSVCTYGSSFGVVDRLVTLGEAARVLEDGGWFVCVFNHRVLEDPLQREIETFIRSCLPDYSYGTRRQDQSEIISRSRLFERAVMIESPVAHVRPVAEWLEAWRSHGTLQRQAGDRFAAIVDGIAAIVTRRCSDRVEVPYVTRAWVAPLRPRQAPSFAGR